MNIVDAVKAAGRGGRIKRASWAHDNIYVIPNNGMTMNEAALKHIRGGDVQFSFTTLTAEDWIPVKYSEGDGITIGAVNYIVEEDCGDKLVLRMAT